MLPDIDPKAIEAAADEVVGPVGNVEYKQFMEKLGGTRRNRVFSFFEIILPAAKARRCWRRPKKRSNRKLLVVRAPLAPLKRRKGEVKPPA